MAKAMLDRRSGARSARSCGSAPRCGCARQACYRVRAAMYVSYPAAVACSCRVAAVARSSRLVALARSSRLAAVARSFRIAAVARSSRFAAVARSFRPVSYTHLRAHETRRHL
eukprot:6359846-Prorocentrum_lima.AAC.1